MENQNGNEKNRGGYRPGAGRKKIADRGNLVGYRVSDKAKANITAYAQAHGLSVNEAVNAILEALAD